MKVNVCDWNWMFVLFAADMERHRQREFKAKNITSTDVTVSVIASCLDISCDLSFSFSVLVWALYKNLMITVITVFFYSNTFIHTLSINNNRRMGRLLAQLERNPPSQLIMAACPLTRLHRQGWAICLFTMLMLMLIERWVHPVVFIIILFFLKNII